MLRRVFPLFIILILAFSINLLAAPKDILKHVNPFIGTGGHGHTFPGATMPFGMVQLSPDTRVEGWDACSGYHYSDSTVLGFSHTHVSGTGAADLGDILITPISGPLSRMAGTHAAGFHHANEHASPGYYSVVLDNPAIKVELTATERVGVHRYAFPKKSDPGLIIDLLHGLGPDQVTGSSLQWISDREVTGMRRSTGWAPDQVVYFAAQFSAPIESLALYLGDTLQSGKAVEGTNVKGLLRFKLKSGQQLMVKVGISTVDINGARNNLNTEAPGWDFNALHSVAEKAWLRELGRITVKGGADSQQTTFYTALYHAMIAPNIASDVDGRYRGMDKATHTAKGFTMYTVFSLWDTFRGEHPLMTIIEPERTLDFVKSLLAKYDEQGQGMLPLWDLECSETWSMIGYHSVSVILDAYRKGITGFDTAHAFEAMKRSANAVPPSNAAYWQSGYFPAELEGESVSRTLEYAYDDWCVARMAEMLGRADDVAAYDERAQFYKNLYDPSTGFMRPRINDAWASPFDPATVTIHYTESNAWQYSFFAPQDVPGLIALYGGAENFTLKLDSLFSVSSHLSGREQADIAGMIGQYAHGNEPCHHVAYLYAEAGQPWKTQQLVRKIMDSLYTARVDGLCGNDDCGQMSAWYVLSAMGFYPVTPGKPEYTLGSPLFDEVTLHHVNGKNFTIRTRGNNKRSLYIQSARLNHTALDMPALSHAALMAGGTLDLAMGSAPNASWGAANGRVYHTVFSKPIAIVPTIDAPKRVFYDSLLVTLHSPEEKNAALYYTIDGSIPSKDSKRYTGPFALIASDTVRAIAVCEGELDSRPGSAAFVKMDWKGTIRLNTPYSKEYSGGGDNALVDGLLGGGDSRMGAWQGYEQNDLDAVIDLGALKQLDSVSVRSLQETYSSIYYPLEVQVSCSTDGTNFGNPVTVKNDIPPNDDVAIKAFTARLSGAPVRYIHVRAKNMGICPPGSRSAGQKALLFVDEVMVGLKR